MKKKKKYDKSYIKYTHKHRAEFKWTRPSTEKVTEPELIRKGITHLNYFHCNLCNKSESLAYSGRRDIVKHSETSGHQKRVKAEVKEPGSQTQTKLDKHTTQTADAFEKTCEKARREFLQLCSDSNIPMSFCEQFNRKVANIFSDSKIASNWKLGATTSTTKIKELGTEGRQWILTQIKDNFYTLSTDGGSKYLSKLYSALIYGYNPVKEEMGWWLLDVHENQGRATGANIANLLKQSFGADGLDYNHLLALSADSTNTMSGTNEGLYGQLLREAPHILFSGCVNHLIDVAAKKGSAALPYDVDEVIIKIWYYLDNSDVRQLEMKDFQRLMGYAMKKLMKHVKSRWLSIDEVLPFYLEQWPVLKAFFKKHKDEVLKEEEKLAKKLHKVPPPKHKKLSKEEEATQKKKEEEVKSKRLKRSQTVLTIYNSLTSNLCILSAHFLKEMSATICEYSRLFQADEPIVHVCMDMMESLMRRLHEGILRPVAYKDKRQTLVNHTAEYHILPEDEIAIGDSTRAFIESNKDQISAASLIVFYNSVKEYYKRVLTYLKTDVQKYVTFEFLERAKVANTQTLDSASPSQIKYFLNKYPAMKEKYSYESLSRELRSLQATTLPDHVLKTTPTQKYKRPENCPLPKEKPVQERQDKPWVYISKITDPVTQQPRFANLASFMLDILCVPVSQATAERLFSMIRKVYKKDRPSMSMDTLNGIMRMKCNKWICDIINMLDFVSVPVV